MLRHTYDLRYIITSMVCVLLLSKYYPLLPGPCKLIATFNAQLFASQEECDVYVAGARQGALDQM
jgi:hypothetical protein